MLDTGLPEGGGAASCGCWSFPAAAGWVIGLGVLVASRACAAATVEGLAWVLSAGFLAAGFAVPVASGAFAEVVASAEASFAGLEAAEASAFGLALGTMVPSGLTDTVVTRRGFPNIELCAAA